MKDFAQLFNALDETTKNSRRVEALVAYFRTATPEDAAWALHLLNQGKPPYRVNSRLLRECAAELSGLPLWLIEESYALVGDLAETLALCLNPLAGNDWQPSLAEALHELGQLKTVDEEERRRRILDAWQALPKAHRFVFNKLMTGGFRVGVARGLLSQALAQVLDRPREAILADLMGDWIPSETFWLELKSGSQANPSRPYPFFLASPLEETAETLGAPEDFLIEYKWDGIRAQLVVREGQIALWSRGEEMINPAFPDVVAQAEALPDGTVLDGELIVEKDGQVSSFNALQKRLNRKKPGSKLLAESPATLRVYDVLEWNGKDLRTLPLAARRAQLEQANLPFKASELLEVESWEGARALREGAREARAEGLMLKRKTSPYAVGRKRGDWFKWKLDPLTLDVVLLYAQAGHGNRANQFTDYTLGVWQGDTLTPIAKAYSGLTREEIKQLDQWIKSNTLERFGPVRQVPAAQVFELGFEGIAASPRHKSGLALRFPRILRWRTDKPIGEANTLDDAHALLESLPG